jgi:hypothetical protein
MILFTFKASLLFTCDYLAGVPSPENDTEMNDSVVFGYLVAWFLGEVCLYMLSMLAFLTGRSNRLSSLLQRKRVVNPDRYLIWRKFKDIYQNLSLLHTFTSGLLVLH